MSFLRELIEHHELLYFLTLKEVRIRYKQSIIGVGWALFMPVASMVIFTFVFTRVATLATDVPYPVFSYCGLLPWNLFAQGIATSTRSLVANINLVTKVYMPRIAFPIAAVLSKIPDFFVGFVFVLVLMKYYEISFPWTMLWLPVILSVQLLFTLGLSFLLSMGHLYYRDVDFVMQVVIQLWMYVTSVLYPLKSSDPTLQFFINLNPMTPVIDAYRDVLLRGSSPRFDTFVPAALCSVGVFLLGAYLFRKFEFQFAEYI